MTDHYKLAFETLLSAMLTGLYSDEKVDNAETAFRLAVEAVSSSGCSDEVIELMSSIVKERNIPSDIKLSFLQYELLQD